MKKILPFLLIILVAAAAAGGGFALYRMKRTAVDASAPSPSQPTDDTNVGAKNPPVRGTSTARITLEEFADFRCPPCATLSGVLHKIEEDNRGQVRILFRNYPLQMHQNARPAALAAEAAGLQGKFWEMHDFLYKSQSAWSTVTDVRPLFVSYAAALGLDANRFSADFDKPELDARVSADQERAKSLGVKQTPTVFINGQLLPVTSLNPDGIRQAIGQALAPQPPTS